MKLKIFDKKFECIWIALIITLMLAATFDQYEYTYDQLRNLVVSDEILERGIPTYFGLNFYKHPPLFYYAVSFTSLSGISLYTAGQIVVLLFAFLSVVFVYKLGNELFDRNFARLSAVLFGVSPAFWVWGNRVLHETMIYFFFTASLYFLLLGARKEKTRDWVFFGLLLGLGMLAKVVILLVIPISFFIFVFSSKVIRIGERTSYVNLHLVGKAILSLIIAFLVYFPYMIYKLVNRGPGILAIWVEHIRGDIPWASKVVSTPWYYYILNLHETISVAFVALFSAGLIFMAIKREKRLLLPLMWFLVVIAFFSFPAYKESRLINALFPAAVFISVYGLFKISKKIGRMTHTEPQKILVLLSVLVVAVQSFSSLSVVTNDGHWPSDWKMWGYLKGIRDDGGVIVSDYDYAAIRYFTGKYSDPLVWGSEAHDILDGMMRSSVYYIYKNNANISKDHFQKIRQFEECNCSLYRIKDEFMNNVTFLKTLGDGKPIEGVLIQVFDENGDMLYKVRSNNNGEAFLPLNDGYYHLKGEKICYDKTEAYVELRDREVYECEQAGVSFPSRLNCSGEKYAMNMHYRGCFYHNFTRARF